MKPDPRIETRPVAITRESCRLCGGKWLVPFLDLGEIHLSDFPYPKEELNAKVPLRLGMCSHCNLVQLMETTDPDLLYRKFWYRSGTNMTMRKEMRRLALLASELGKAGHGARWMDIGANDGTLLSQAPSGTYRIGVEPALNLKSDLSRHCEEVHSDCFVDGLTDPVDVIFTAAMFYDLDQPVEFCEAVYNSLKPGGIWINQLSYTPLMLEKLAFDNICHEHLAYYTLETLEVLYYRAGFKVLDVTLNDINGGSMCVVATHAQDPREATYRVAERRSEEQAAQYSIQTWMKFARDVRAWKEKTSKTLDKLAAETKIHLYGASTKGNTLLQYLEAGTFWFEAAAERNPEKLGRLTVGSRIPIISEEASRAMNPGAYFVLPWAFRDEFISREQDFLRNGGKLLFPLPKLETVGVDQT